MTQDTPHICAQEARRRDNILCGNSWEVIFAISLPLVLYTSLEQVFKFIDTLIAANMSSSVISTVSFISQIQTMLSAIGSCLSLGGSIIIARYYGAGNMKEVQKQCSTLFFLCTIIAGLILVVIVPGAVPFLRLFRMPESLIASGAKCLIVEVCALLCVFINSIFIGIQKARGNTKIILLYNLIVLCIKTALNLIFAYVMHYGIISLSVSTLLAQGVLTVIAVASLLSRKNPFCVRIRYCDFSRKVVFPIVNLSLPIFLGKFAFAFGKVIVNTMCAALGTTVIGALGVSNRIGALSSNPATGFQDGEAPLISQNLGAGNKKRALGIFYRVLVINLVLASICFILTGVFKKDLVRLFAKGNAEFATQIDNIYTYERLDAVLISINASVMGLLYGFGKTRVSMILNLLRLFAFRIPSLYLFIHLSIFASLGIRAVGVAMLVSNCLTGISAAVAAFILIYKLKKT